MKRQVSTKFEFLGGDAVAKGSKVPRRSSSVGRASFKRSLVGATLLTDVGSSRGIGVRKKY